MSLPQTDTRSSLMRHSPSLMVGISTSMNSKSLGPTSCAAFISSTPFHKHVENAQSVATCAGNWLHNTLWVGIVNCLDISKYKHFQRIVVFLLHYRYRRQIRQASILSRQRRKTSGPSFSIWPAIEVHNRLSSPGISHSRSTTHAGPHHLRSPNPFIATQHGHIVFQDIEGWESTEFWGQVCLLKKESLMSF